MLARTIAVTAVLLLTTVPANAWQFNLRSDNGLYYGELVGFDDTGDVRLSATCTRSPRLETVVRVDALAPSDLEDRPDVFAGIAADGSEGRQVQGFGQPFNSFAIPSTSVRNGDAVLRELRSADREVSLAWGSGTAVFDAFDAGPAVQGFETVCASLPIQRVGLGRR